jgi:hypothetical protein
MEFFGAAAGRAERRLETHAACSAFAVGAVLPGPGV